MARYFTWDPAKASSNLKKHGLAFELAARVFSDADHATELESHVQGEERWQTTGMVEAQLFIVVVHTDWDEDDDEVIRIISARRATSRERIKYEQGKTSPIQH